MARAVPSRERRRKAEGLPLEDAVLIERARHGDVSAYDVLVRRYQALATRAAYLILGDAAEAEDAAQEAFVYPSYSAPPRLPSPGAARRLVVVAMRPRVAHDIRAPCIPAHFCSVFGLKPTAPRVPQTGHTGMSVSVLNASIVPRCRRSRPTSRIVGCLGDAGDG